MANAKAHAKYERKRLDVIKKLKAKGRQVSFGNYGDPSKEYLPSEEYIESFTCHVFPLEFNKDFSQDVKKNDLFFMSTNEGNIDTTTILKDDEKKYEIKMVKPFDIDNNVIFYEIQVR